MIAEIQVLPEDALSLTDKVAQRCCEAPDAMIDIVDAQLVLRCRHCEMRVTVPEPRPELRGKNMLKRRNKLRKETAKAVDALVSKWNYKCITGVDE